jgi:hypothetical protein
MNSLYFSKYCRVILMCLCSTLISSCGTSIKGKSIVYTGEEIKNNEGVIHICRVSSFVGVLGGIDIFINNEIAATISSGSVVEVVKNPGIHAVLFKLGNGSKFGVNVNLNAGGHSYVLQTAGLKDLKSLPLGIGYNMGWQSLVVEENTFRDNCSTYSILKIQMP